METLIYFFQCRLHSAWNYVLQCFAAGGRRFRFFNQSMLSEHTGIIFIHESGVLNLRKHIDISIYIYITVFFLKNVDD